MAFKPKKFDGAIFSKMVEPLTLRVERTIGSNRPTPIEMPPKEGQPPGCGWLKDDIRSLEGWLAREWTGGGVYEASLVDDAGVKMDWTFYFDPKQYPPRSPPTLPGMDSAPSTEDLATQQATAQALVTGESNWPPQASEYSSVISPPPAPPAPPAPPQTPRPSTHYPIQGRPMIVPSQFPTTPLASSVPSPANDYERRMLEQQLRAANEQIAKVERERIEAQHQADMERVRQENDRKFEELKRSLTPKDDSRIDKLEQLIVRLLDKPAGGPDPAVLAMQAETARLREEVARAEAVRKEEAARAEAQRREDIARAEAQRREEMQRAADRAEAQRREDLHAREMAELRAQMVAATKPSGPDPMMMIFVDMVKDISRASAAQIENVSRANQAQLDNLRAFMLTPKDIAAMNKESSGAVDDVRRTLMGSFNDLFGMQKQVVENMMAMQPQGESTIDKAIEAARGMADRYMGGQRDVAVSTAKAQAEAAKAQAEMAQAQRAQLEVIARREAEARAADGGLNGHGGGLNGHSNGHATQSGGAVHDGARGVAGQPELAEGASVSVEAAPAAPAGATPAGTAPVIEVIDATAVPTALRYGKTDAEWFGEALPHVGQLRDGVAMYFRSIHATPPDLDAQGRPHGIDAEQAAHNILQAVSTIITNKLTIPAFNDLFLGQRYTEFMDVLLPGTPSKYRGDVMGVIIAQINGVSGEDDDEDDDEDEGASAPA